MPYSLTRKSFESDLTKNFELRRFENEDIELHLPTDLAVSDVKWLSVWCKRFKLSFGDLNVSKGA